MAVQMVQPKARELNRLTKRIRTGHVRFAPSPTLKDDEDGDEEDDASMLNAPLENTLKKILKRTKKPVTPKTPATPSAPPKLIDFDEEEEEDVKPKDLMDFDEPKKTSGWGKAMGKGAIKGVLKSWGVKIEATSDDEDEEEEEDEPPRPKKKKGKQPKGKTRSRKSRKKEAEALKPQPGWEAFKVGKKLRRALVDEYGEETPQTSSRPKRRRKRT